MDCEHDYIFNSHCGADVCTKCGHHKHLERCFCGWSVTNPGHGAQELEEMGETIDEEPYVFYPGFVDDPEDGWS